ncbi:multicopper oxidase domain-containing protein [Stieleria sp. TO1_6]|uniref:multicopper oxidase domain-containing protein n=1 Tax=Stieleria tagensis TaxID=2956795 RepID=UPI00209B5747|nr:multicopper oxidase domain-containing protein [Stieleria tagensis]MCO8123076.1 multicopper oxidase domain-containing protein [Stieleria tagensis]
MREIQRRSERSEYQHPEFRSGEERVSENGILDTSLAIIYDNRKGWRPTTYLRDGNSDLVVKNNAGIVNLRMRSYDQLPVGPTLRVRAGDVLRVHLKNQLPVEKPENHSATLNTPHGFNRTNLHTHGLHVSPAANSDNVLLEVHPGQEFESEIAIPTDHLPGTFWYHAHVHGATSIQVSSGMAGALIIEPRKGDQTSIESVPGIAGVEERICLFQQVSFLPEPLGYQLQLLPDAPDTDSLPTQGNGLAVVAKIAGKLHFRVFDASGLKSADLGESDLADKPEEIERLRQALQSVWPPDPIPQEQAEAVVAAVGSILGLTTYTLEDFGAAFANGRWPRGKVEDGWRTTINGQVQPVIKIESGRIQRFRFIHGGVRDEIRVQLAPIPLESAIDDESLPYDVEALNEEGMREIAVDGIPLERMRKTETISLFPGYRSDVLVRLTNDTSQTQRYLMWDGAGNVSLDPSAPDAEKDPAVLAIIEVRPSKGSSADAWPSAHDFSNVRRPDPIPDGEVFGLQAIKLQLRPSLSINGEPFDPDGRPITLQLGRADQWKLTTDLGSHPFHIHVNPFYFVSETNSAGMTTPQGVWRDTLLVRSGTTYDVRTRYRRYIGDFVLHCHILDHEDQGMMKVVRVVNDNYEVGTKLAKPYLASSWTLPDASGTDQSLTDLMGEEFTILVFLESQGCPACNEQIQNFSNASIPDGVKIVFVAPGAKEAGFPGPMFPHHVVFDASDQRDVFRDYECYLATHQSPLHGAFILDDQGRVRWREISDEPFMEIEHLLNEIELMGTEQ